MSKRTRILLIVAGFLLVVLTGLYLATTNGLGDVREETVYAVDISALPDGNYEGHYNIGRWANTVSVVIENHIITAITVTKDVVTAGITDCAGEIISRVIAAQSLDIDVVSGATATSKAYLKAIEDALTP